MSIRRKRRQRGRRKALHQAALETWSRLTQIDKPVAPRQACAGITLSLIRWMWPRTIANSLVGVQPMTMPANMISNTASGTEPTFKYRDSYENRTKKEIQEQRKKERKNKKRKSSSMEATSEYARISTIR